MSTNNAEKSSTTIDWPDLIAQLSQPFPEQLIKWRIGSISKDKTKAQALAYAEPRVYEDVLNSVCPGSWAVSFRPWGEHRIICDLTIHGVTRSSTGEEGNSPDGIAGTAAEAQAFKRACSKFGLGRYLYDMPSPWVPYDPQTKRFKEQPRINTPRRQEQAASSTPKPEPATLDDVIGSKPQGVETLSRDRASNMHRELAKLGVGRSQHYAFATKVLGREVKSFTDLTEHEAKVIWTAVKTSGGKVRPAA